ncbi:hypothetical protein FHG66_03815 [Rubellimicrobium rubrum]|uniref:Polysaccharide lyase family 7 protein n=1 Tax=Rubellimicrobium rubrum TaxID=2585369 RepID=A0A5C4N286_9RHOB|nr:polysaccharide lyase family 7 protein [Rubellimicrobium rubrum]TNC51944.1 hypothetical protein FHG66_03815 [Rubellimicrobium rubrum]
MPLSASVRPGQNFDLRDWKLQLPVDSAGGFAGRYTEIKDLSSYVSDWFRTGSDGAMVLQAPVEGVTTGGARYARSELRELVGGQNAAWTLDQGGSMAVAMQVDYVPQTFDGAPAKVVVGQIHGGDHQLVRMYWENGTVYWVNGRNEVQARDAHHEFKDAQGRTPQVSLDETFTYSFAVKGHALTLTLQADGTTYTSSITIGGGWDDNRFYFKAGLYLGTNEETSRGEGQVSIYGIDVRHDGAAVVDRPDTTPVEPPNEPGTPTAPVNGGTGTLPPPPPPPAPPPTSGSGVVTDGGSGRVLQGTSGNDVFVVSHKSTTVRDLGGQDIAQSTSDWVMSEGVETLALQGSSNINGVGSNGNDVIIGNAGANFLKGNTGDDALSGNGGDDRLFGSAGNDLMQGGDGADLLDGSAGNDRLEGGAGNDILFGSSQQDSLTGAEGADTFVFTALSHSRVNAADVITDFTSGADRIDLQALDADTTRDGDQAFTWGGSGIGHLVLQNRHLVADLNGDGRMDFDLDLRSARIQESDILL